MSEYTRESLRMALEKEAPRVKKYLDSKGLHVDANGVKQYYKHKDITVSKNAIKKMVQHMS